MRNRESGWCATSCYQTISILGILFTMTWVCRARMGQLPEEVKKHKSSDLAWSKLASSFLKFLSHIFLLDKWVLSPWDLIPLHPANRTIFPKGKACRQCISFLQLVTLHSSVFFLTLSKMLYMLLPLHLATQFM